jgi:hypothetical protein
MVSIAASRGQPTSAICDLAAANPHKEKMPGTCQFRSLYVGEELNTPPNWPCCSGCASGHGGCGTGVGDTSTDVRSPTSTSTDVRSPTSTSTDVRSPTSTSTEAYTAGNFTSTVTGGAGAGAYTNVSIYPNSTGKPLVSGDSKSIGFTGGQKKALGSCGGNCGQTMGSASGFGNGSPSTTNGPGSYRDGSSNYPFPRTAGGSNAASGGSNGGSGGDGTSATSGSSNGGVSATSGGSGGNASGGSNGGVSTTSGHSEGYNGYGSRSLVPTGGSASGSGNGAGQSGSRGIQGLGDTTGASTTSYATPLIIGLAALAAGFGLAYVAMRPAKTEKEIREEVRRRRR